MTQASKAPTDAAVEAPTTQEAPEATTPETPPASPERPAEQPPLNLRTLFEAGVHFGHPTKRWNPKMREYIHTKRAGSHIIDLTKTLSAIDRAFTFTRDTVASGGICVLVGTKKQAQDPIETEAARCGTMFINQRWLGGMLTNFQTIQLRIDHLVHLEEAFAKGEVQATTKREAQRLAHEVERLNKYLGGIKEMTKLPDALFVVDIQKEKIAVAEANRLGIPVVAIVDTDSDPTSVQYPIPGNDDGVRSIHRITSRIADAILEGRDLGKRLEEERLADEAELEAQESAARAREQAEAAARLAMLEAASASSAPAPVTSETRAEAAPEPAKPEAPVEAAPESAEPEAPAETPKAAEPETSAETPESARPGASAEAVPEATEAPEAPKPEASADVPEDEKAATPEDAAGPKDAD